MVGACERHFRIRAWYKYEDNNNNNNNMHYPTPFWVLYPGCYIIISCCLFIFSAQVDIFVTDFYVHGEDIGVPVDVMMADQTVPYVLGLGAKKTDLGTVPLLVATLNRGHPP